MNLGDRMKAYGEEFYIFCYIMLKILLKNVNI